MSLLPPEFQFSQGSLQDYLDCPRRFELRYLLKCQWPALKSEPVLDFERRAELGRRFHEMVHQSILGMPPEHIALQAADPELATWWNEFTRSPILQNLPARRRAEFSLAAPFAGYRLAAKYDLLAVDAGRRAVIVDWKTAGRPPRRGSLADRLQTRVYLYLWIEAGRTWNGGQPPAPETLEMIYWFTSEPAQPIHFHYNPTQFQNDRAYLTALVREIAARPAGGFPLTPDEKKCLYCEYRSLCSRGVRAGSLDEADAEGLPASGLDVPFEQIGEIEF
jgi:hypothetical protein